MNSYVNGQLEPIADVDLEGDLDKKMNIERLYNCLRLLQEQQRIAIMYHFGLVTDWKVSNSEVGERIGMSKDGTRLFIKRALKRLRELYKLQVIF